MTNSQQKLRNVLKANAAFSGSSGIALACASTPLGQLMQIENSSILIYIGIGLIAFAISLLLLARKTTIDVPKVKFIIWQDWAWVVGSAIIVAFQLFDLSMVAYVLITLVALLVGLFAVLQGKHLKQN
jgi:lipid A disaccharide synthetase